MDGERPKAIPMMPEVIDIATYRKIKTLQKLYKQQEFQWGLILQT